MGFPRADLTTAAMSVPEEAIHVDKKTAELHETEVRR